MGVAAGLTVVAGTIVCIDTLIGWVLETIGPIVLAAA
jgi:hypothetical protein